MLVLLYLLFLSRYDSFWSDWEAYWNYSMVNFNPFSTIFRYLRAARRIPQIAATNLLGNLVLFMPMGSLFASVVCTNAHILAVFPRHAGRACAGGGGAARPAMRQLRRGRRVLLNLAGAVAV